LSSREMGARNRARARVMVDAEDGTAEALLR